MPLELGHDRTRMVGIRFTETMRGFFSIAVKDSRYEEAERLGRQEKTPFEFTLTITADDVDRSEHHPDAGALVLQALGPVFVLFIFL
jgi:hypothetical protein